METIAAFAPDIRTLAGMIVAVLLLASAVYAGLWVQGTGGRASGYWALGHALGTLGYFLISLRGLLPDLLSITLANPLILAGGLLLVKGLRTLLGRPFPDRAAAAGLAAVTAVFAYFTHVEPAIGIRTLVVTALGAAILAAGAWTLVHLPRAERGWVHIYTAAAFLGVALVQLLRFAATLAQPYQGGLMQASFIHGLGMVVVLLGAVTWTLGFLWMITLGLRRDLESEVATRRRREQTLRESEQRFRAIFDTTATGIAFGDAEGNILQVNGAFAELVGRDREDLRGRHFVDITHPDDRAVEADKAAHLLESGADHYRLEKRYLTADGATVWVDLTVSAIRDEDGRPLHFVGVANDIGERKALQDRLERQATYDPLTGAMNRRQFANLLEREQGRVNRYQGPAALIMLDLDRFKAINDRHGHGAGDRVLQSLSGLIRDRLRESDTLARWGGEEFLVLLPETGLEGAQVLAEELRRTVAVHAFDDLPTVTVSLGVAGLQPGEAVHELMVRVDDALYRAKRAGRDRVAPADPAPAAPSP